MINNFLQKKGFYVALLVGGIGVFSLCYTVKGIKEAGDKLASINKARNSLEQNINNDISSNYALNDKNKEDRTVVKEKLKEKNVEKDKKLKVASKKSKDVVQVVRAGDKITKLNFDEEKGLTWPIQGKIVKEYSMDRLVYFPTLGVFKANPAIFIQGKENMDVKAAYRGIVTRVDEDKNIGKFVEMVIGDNYKLIYGQLKDIKVKKGDDIVEGQVIGKLAKVTPCYSKEGIHLYFKVMENNKNVNPLLLLK